jgi:uncharacterized membrane protein YphA (DoxX/SURF4 family)
MTFNMKPWAAAVATFLLGLALIIGIRYPHHSLIAVIFLALGAIFVGIAQTGPQPATIQSTPKTS